MTPAEFHKKYQGWGRDVDGVAGIQCVDLFKEFLRIIGVPTWSAPIGGDGYADNIWFNRSRWSAWLTPVPRGSFRDGDIVLFPHARRGGITHPSSHVCFYYGGKEFGTNQSADRKACDKNTKWTDALGGLRWKGWGKMDIPEGYSRQTINGHKYTMYRQSETEKAAVLSAGSGQLRSIAAQDADVLITAKIAGANFFQMKEGQEDAYGTHYGDESAPLNGVYVIVPGQDTTMYYNLDTGEYGDCKDYYPSRDHNVFSPALVFPAEGNFQYARMVGIDHVNYASMYTVLVRLASGKHIMAITEQALTPRQIYADLKTIDFFMSMAVLDGGDSAQMACWHDGKMDYVRKTSRLIPSVVCFYKPKSSETAKDDKDSGTDYKALYEALKTKYEDLQKTNEENKQVALDLKKKYEEAIEKILDILKGVSE